MKIRTLLLSILLITLSPVLVFAQASSLPGAVQSPVGNSAYQFQDSGILGCSQNGAYAKSVGAFTANGVYVPVSDAVVELNTGYLVYDECVLREVIDRLRDSAITQMTNQITGQITQGNNGNPQYSVNLGNEMQTKYSNALAAAVSNGITNNVNAAFQSTVKSAIVQNNYAAINSPTAALSCPYTGNLTALYQGQTTDSALSALGYLALPTCTAIGAYNQANAQATAVAANVVNNALTQLQWGQGMYPRGSTDAYGNIIVSTPSQTLFATLNQAITSGFRLTENANDIGQMTTSLLANLSSAVTGASVPGYTNQSLASVSQGYMQSATSLANTGVTQGIAGAALSILSGAIQTEQSYYQTASSIANTLSTAIGTLRGQEAGCWNSIISDVCQAGTLSYNSNGTATCTEVQTGTASISTVVTSNGHGGTISQTVTTAPSTVTLTIATSTYGFAQQIINTNIAATASSTLQEINVAQQNIQTLTQIQNNAQSSSVDTQNQAVDNVDQLTSTGQLQTPNDLVSIQQAQTTIQQTSTNLVQTVQSNWTTTSPDTGNPADPNSGWCNVGNPSTLQMWEQIWST